jgi:hypothetical protein
MGSYQEPVRNSSSSGLMLRLSSVPNAARLHDLEPSTGMQSPFLCSGGRFSLGYTRGAGNEKALHEVRLRAIGPSK